MRVRAVFLPHCPHHLPPYTTHPSPCPPPRSLCVRRRASASALRRRLRVPAPDTHACGHMLLARKRWHREWGRGSGARDHDAHASEDEGKADEMIDADRLLQHEPLKQEEAGEYCHLTRTRPRARVRPRASAGAKHELGSEVHAPRRWRAKSLQTASRLRARCGWLPGRAGRVSRPRRGEGGRARACGEPSPGTCRQYSPKAKSQEKRIAFHIGHSLCLRWRYHAAVITQHEHPSRHTHPTAAHVCPLTALITAGLAGPPPEHLGSPGRGCEHNNAFTRELPRKKFQLT